MRLSAALSPRALLLLLVACCGWGALPAHADGNVGCLFSESLCSEKIEWCYDDYAFGKCLQVYGSVEEEDLARHELTTEELRGFERELQRLLLLGYRWSHAYTQCVLQAMLYATRNRLHYDATVCDRLADQDLTAALGAFEAGDEVDPASVAFVRYTPNTDIDHDSSDFADEVYFPPNEGEYLENLPMLPEAEMPIDMQESHQDYGSWQEEVKRSYRRKNKRAKDHDRSAQREHFQVFSRIYNTPGDFREGHETRDLSNENLESIFGNTEEYPPNAPSPLLENEEDNPGLLPNVQLTNDDILYLLQPENEQELRALFPQYNEESESPDEEFAKEGDKDPINKWLETQDLDQLRAALAELKEPLSDRMDPYYVSTSEFLTKNRLRPDRFNQHYNTPDRFRQGYESKDGVVNGKEDAGVEIPEQRIYSDEDEQDHYREESGSGEHDGNAEKQRELEYLANNEVARHEYPRHDGPHVAYDGEQTRDESRQAALLARLLNTWRSGAARGAPAYTEGGRVYVGDAKPTSRPDNAMASQLLGPELGALLADYEWGFRRRERLDVKKPGPPFDKNNHLFKTDQNNNTKPAVVDEAAEAAAPLMVKKELHETAEKSELNHSHDNYDVDSSYAYVGFKDSIRTWKEGARVVRTIGELLHLEPSSFSYPRVDRNEVTFRVEENSKSLNASEVASRIDGIKDDLKRELGVEVTSAGVGDKAKYPAVLKTDEGEVGWEKTTTGRTAAIALLAGSIAAAVVAAIVLVTAIYSRVNNYKQRKLRGLATVDTEASQDYQDLCRARMSGKWTTNEKSGLEGKQETSGQRITSLSRESDGNSPSTRSSTSSWSEEPALTNMDISTGHMVLTYMEDHLKNKDRLEQEWRALCAYEAEPCATTAAEKPENKAKNRTPGVLPYDHARLVLNDVTNLTNEDYINASTIRLQSLPKTDHDPRNPAYIAAQGPLADTAADWWQLVWEQGSVVLVMLTRLTEGGTTLCHRYWPEEGSQTYHIYEVHLVSEHIWCDDYLVRSFYLKNLKTGETRTVTQFHFLSWPDRGVPSSTKALLEFRRKVNKSYRGRSCPIVVHCSDGAGRTGTYCLIDMVLNRMAKGAKEIDIAATLEHIRDQRPHMVTTKQQFEFVLMAVAEEVHAILKALPAQLQQQHEKREKELAAEKEKQDKEKEK